MNYLILETGLETSSEAQFWQKVFLFNATYIFANGNKNILSGIIKMQKTGYILGNKLSAEDKIYLCYDSINKYGKSGTYADGQVNLYNECIRWCRKIKSSYNCDIFISKDFCFETMLLRLKCVYDIVENSLGRCKNYRLTPVELSAKNLIAKQSLIDTIEGLLTVRDALGLVSATPESIASMWLNHLLGNKQFKVTKGGLGICWHNACDFTRQTELHCGTLICPMRGYTLVDKKDLLLEGLGVLFTEELFYLL